MNFQHWLVAHRLTDSTPTVPAEGQDKEEQATRVLVGPLTRSTDRSRQEHAAWTRDTLAEVYGYSSLGEMESRITSDPVWYDFEVEDMTERDLSPWEAQQPVQLHAGALVVHGQVGEAVSDSDSVLSQYGSTEESDDEEDAFSRLRDTRSSDTTSSRHGSYRIDTPSSAAESYDGNAQLMLQALTPVNYSIEDHTMVLYQDLMSLFRNHTDAQASHSQTASMLANTEMEHLMSRYEDSLAYIEQTSTTPPYFYSGISERVKQSIIYCSYIASDRAYFPTSPFSAIPWSYLGPKTYSASRLKRQRISSDTLMVFQNKRAVLREFKDVLWGRRRYLRWLEQYPEVVAKAMWMLDPTFTHTRVGLIDSLIERLEE